MKPHKLLIALSVLFSCIPNAALALDRLFLKNGSVVDGKLLSTLPGRYYDFQDIAGNKKRFRMHTEQHLDHNLSSVQDEKIHENTADLFITGNMSVFLGNRRTDSPRFNWGARLGFNATPTGTVGKLSYAVSYNHLSYTPAGSTLSYTVGELMFQVLIRKLFNTGIYFGPEAGIGLLSSSVSGTTSTSRFDYGALVGYDYHLDHTFSFGPEIHYTAMNYIAAYKFLFGLTYHI